MLTHLLEDERSINQQLVEMGMLIIRSASGSLQIGWSGDRLDATCCFFQHGSLDLQITRFLCGSLINAFALVRFTGSRKISQSGYGCHG